jgi:predicted RNase H-like HicB family nuclease
MKKVVQPVATANGAEPPCELKRWAKKLLAGAGDREHQFPMHVEIEKEEDGRWIAEVPTLHGAMAYGSTKVEAIAKVEALVLRALADKIEHGEDAPELSQVFTVAA